MKTIWSLLAVVACVLAMALPVAAETGNGAPNGAHYNLNIIGVPKDKNPDMSNNSGHRISVPLESSAKIYLSEGEFAVLDANGTDGVAEFQLPLPAECYGTKDPVTGDIVTPTTCTVRYTVWIRALGKPGGSADMYTCIEDPDLPGGYMCSDPAWWVEVTRSRGKSTFTNVSRELLFVSADVDADGKIEHVQIFDPLFDDYYWQYDNYGLKLAQLRYYMGDFEIKW